jgi:hypothetical protein
VSEWEEFTAYAGIVKRAKAEERDRIVKAFMESFTQLQYFYDGVVKNLVAHVDRPEYCEFVIRDIIKEKTDV